jgi:hypothetical protein
VLSDLLAAEEAEGPASRPSTETRRLELHQQLAELPSRLCFVSHLIRLRCNRTYLSVMATLERRVITNTNQEFL